MTDSDLVRLATLSDLDSIEELEGRVWANNTPKGKDKPLKDTWGKDGLAFTDYFNLLAALTTLGDDMRPIVYVAQKEDGNFGYLAFIRRSDENIRRVILPYNFQTVEHHDAEGNNLWIVNHTTTGSGLSSVLFDHAKQQVTEKKIPGVTRIVTVTWPGHPYVGADYWGKKMGFAPSLDENDPFCNMSFHDWSPVKRDGSYAPESYKELVGGVVVIYWHPGLQASPARFNEVMAKRQ